MILKNKHQRQKYFQLAELSTQILKKLVDSIAVGVTGEQIDELAWQLCRLHQVKPSFASVKGKRGDEYGHATCIGVNEVVVHGKPTPVAFQTGDLVTIDFGITDGELVTDQAHTVGIGPVSELDAELLIAGQQAVWRAVQHVKQGVRVGTLGATMSAVADQAGFQVVREYVGHGIGTTLHDDPEIPAWGEADTGYVLQKGEVICVEAQLVAGSNKLKTLSDDWTVVTQDGSNSVMFEYMVEVGKNRPLVLTPHGRWELRN